MRKDAQKMIKKEPSMNRNGYKLGKMKRIGVHSFYLISDLSILLGNSRSRK